MQECMENKNVEFLNKLLVHGSKKLKLIFDDTKNVD